MNKKLGKKQFLVPYLMSSHPGSTLKEAVELAEYCRDMGYIAGAGAGFLPDAVHIVPHVCTYTGLDPRTMEPVYVPKNPHERQCRER